MLILFISLTLNLLTTTIVALPSNASKWQMGFNSAFKGLIFDTCVKIQLLDGSFLAHNKFFDQLP